jgi:uncharacterized membrane protein YphA (DoxX/SURF4 family)
MLSLLPGLLAFEQLAPFLLRLTLGFIFIHWAYKTWKVKTESSEAVFSILFGVLGLLFIFGLFTQLAGIVSFIYFGIKLYGKLKEKAFLTDGVNYYVILLIISFCLIVSGAGTFAFDLPL